MAAIAARFRMRQRERLGFRLALAIKRGIDIVGSAGLLLLLSPLLLAAIIAVKLSSPGPAFYIAPRWGRDETSFPCFKLRSMRTDQSAILGQHGLAYASEGGRLLVHRRDPRVTAVGAFLRKYSIDELPQLLNVLRGEMSLVGPRALATALLADYPALRAARGVMRPGISGLWQVSARSKNVTALDMAAEDLDYIERFSLWMDVRILLRTFGAIVEPDIE
jgi:exopolysaccharide production protein ExoY